MYLACDKHRNSLFFRVKHDLVLCGLARHVLHCLEFRYSSIVCDATDLLNNNEQFRMYVLESDGSEVVL